MKTYKEIENGIEYDVFELNDTELYYQVREIEKLEHSKIIRNFDGYKQIYYFKKGEGHNEHGPCGFIVYDNGEKEPLCYFFDGDSISIEEWLCYHRTKMIDNMTDEKKYYEIQKINNNK